jgi:hypothetical protein
MNTEITSDYIKIVNSSKNKLRSFITVLIPITLLIILLKDLLNDSLQTDQVYGTIGGIIISIIIFIASNYEKYFCFYYKEKKVIITRKLFNNEKLLNEFIFGEINNFTLSHNKNGKSRAWLLTMNLGNDNLRVSGKTFFELGQCHEGSDLIPKFQETHKLLQTLINA